MPGGVVGEGVFCAALDNLNMSRLIFCYKLLEGSNSCPHLMEGLHVHASEEVTPQRSRPLVEAGGPRHKRPVHKRDSSSLVIDTGNCLSVMIMALNTSSYQQ